MELIPDGVREGVGKLFVDAPGEPFADRSRRAASLVSLSSARTVANSWSVCHSCRFRFATIVFDFESFWFATIVNARGPGSRDLDVRVVPGEVEYRNVNGVDSTGKLDGGMKVFVPILMELTTDDGFVDVLDRLEELV